MESEATGDRRDSVEMDQLSRRVDDNHHQLEELVERMDRADRRADASDRRAEAADERARAMDERASASEGRAGDDRRRLTDVEGRLDIDREMLERLETEGVLNQQHIGHLLEALKTSREIGAAIGIIMTQAKVSQEEAFRMLVTASQDTNRKLRDMADEVLETGDVRILSLNRP